MRHKYVQWTDYESFVRQVANAKALIAQLASADVVEIGATPDMALRCRRGWPSDRSARVELRSFNHDRERIR